MTSTAAPITYERLVSWDWRPHAIIGGRTPMGRHYLCPTTNTSATPARAVRTMSTRTEPSHLDAIRGVA